MRSSGTASLWVRRTRSFGVQATSSVSRATISIAAFPPNSGAISGWPMPSVPSQASVSLHVSRGWAKGTCQVLALAVSSAYMLTATRVLALAYAAVKSRSAGAV